ncbi:hypothetical protein A1O3_01450 [Capronia epimyces CBS 606.96]|uniref:Uncharacterized protein n=1 Tax=Capronia epimyces CBS 606.96 TaxID=1182542 RepID=W9YUH7_9EURO|nr:uncharacterized protein A1O3_01450 [Capronia epimyces CBS 606.96]EXJ92896.1 hypothetical protein A1O3_01450 [Capronia epimyces CBS 606.96]
MLVSTLVYMKLKPPFTHTTPGPTCGRAVDEALTLGCRWDGLAHMWLPRHCSSARHDEITENLGGEPSYTAWDAARTIDLRRVPSGEKYHTTGREDTAHCAFNMLRLVDQICGQGHFGSSVTTPEHVEHCIYLLLNMTRADPRQWEQGLVKGSAAFGGDCAYAQ